MKNVGRGPLGRGEAGVKVGDDDLGQMTSKSGEKTFLSRDEIFHVQSRGCESPLSFKCQNIYAHASIRVITVSCFELQD